METKILRTFYAFIENANLGQKGKKVAMETQHIYLDSKLLSPVVYIMAIGVMEFSREGYKIRKDFA